MVTHMMGGASFTYGIALDTADQVADAYADNIKAAAADARRKRSGLVLPE